MAQAEAPRGNRRAQILGLLRPGRHVRRALLVTIGGSLAIQLSLLVSGTALARALGPTDRGHLALLTLVAGLACQLGSLGLPFAISYSVARFPDRSGAIVRALLRPMWVYAAWSTAAAALLLLVLTSDRPDYVRAGALIILVFVAPAIVQQCRLAVLQGLRRFSEFNVLRSAPTAAFAAATVTLIVTGGDGLVEFTIAWVATLLAFVPATSWAAGRAIEARGTASQEEAPDRAAMLRFGRQSLLGASPPIENYRLDQSAVALFLSASTLGIYVAASAFSNLPRFIAQSVGFVATPNVASHTSDAHARRAMWRFFWLGVPLYMPVVIGLWVLLPDLTRLFFGEEFADAAPIGRLLLVASALFCARRILSDAARGAGYPTIGSVAEIVALATALPLFAIFAPLWEADGVAYALIASSTISLVVLVLGLLRNRGDAPAGRTIIVPPAMPSEPS